MRRLYDRLWGRAAGVDRLARAILAVVALAAAGVIAISVRDDDPGPASTASGDSTPAEGRQLPPCRDANIPDRPTRAVTCRSGDRVLTIAAEGEPLLLGSTQSRVLDVTRSGATVTVRLRLRNEDSRPRTPRRRQVYLTFAGSRVYPTSPAAQAIPPATGRTLRVRFALRPGQRRTLRRLRGRADVGVETFEGAKGGETRVAVTRVRVPL